MILIRKGIFVILEKMQSPFYEIVLKKGKVSKFMRG